MAQAQEIIELPANEPPAISTAMTPMQMLDRALTNNASVEIMEKLLALQERWERNQGRKAFDAAMANAKAEIPVIVKNRTADFPHKTGGGRTQYKYEDMGEIARTIDPILARHGLSYRFRTSASPNEPVTVTCILSHRDGHYEENTLSAGRDDTGSKNLHQAIGSTSTYLQRYTLKAALGLAASIDDDGGAAGGAGNSPAHSGLLATNSVIADEQAKQLQMMIVEAGADLPAFLDHFKIERLDDLPAGAFERAKKLLEMKAQRAKK